jgi:putative flavoprotein involved in K+ transport
MRYDVVVVGGGQAGLAIAWHLRRLRSTYAVLDASNSVGHSWRTRWDSLALFTPARYDALPGLAFPAPADMYPGKDAVADYLVRYAAAFDLPVRLNTRVTALRRAGDGFEIHTGDEVLRAAQVVVATGAFQNPYVPPVAGMFDPTVTQLHSSGYRTPQALPYGPTLVVGGGNSGLQIAEEVITTRDAVVSIGRQPTVLPQRLAGRDLFWWLTRLGVMRVRSASRLGRRLRSRGEFVIGTSRRRLRRSGVRFRPRLVTVDGRTARFADGRSLDVSVVIWATGYRPDYSWISIPGLVRDGRPVHDRGVTDVPGLYFLGLPWQHTRGSALLGFVADDASHIAGHITDRIAARAGEGAR